jgi:ribosomal protein S18 acetylase RimI-like enzyme
MYQKFYLCTDEKSAMIPESTVLQRFSVPIEVTIRLCRRDDLPALEWFGLFTAHREIIRAVYDSQERGETIMLVAEAQGFPIGQAWIDLTRMHVDATAVLWAVRVFPTLQNLGIGTRLMAVAEEMLRHRACACVELGVEKENPNARRFYERQGYHVVGMMQGEYGYTTPDGVATRVPTDQWILRKPLTP